MPTQRKHIRLNNTCYVYPSNPCSITIGIKNRQNVFGFDFDHFTKNAVDILRTVAEKNKQMVFPIYIALFMPDHVHLCLEASPAMNIVEYVKEIKSRIAVTALRHGHHGSFWQPSFFDHFLRADENIGQVVRYILNNPCRQNLVTDWLDYPYLYSNVYTISELTHGL